MLQAEGLGWARCPGMFGNCKCPGASGELSESQAGEEPLHGSPGFLAEAFSFDVIKDNELLKDFTQKSYMIGSGLQHFREIKLMSSVYV